MFEVEKGKTVAKITGISSADGDRIETGIRRTSETWRIFSWLGGVAGVGEPHGREQVGNTPSLLRFALSENVGSAIRGK